MFRVSSFGALEAPWRDDLIQKTKRLVPFEWKEIPLKRCPNERPSQLLPEEKSFLDKNEKFWLLDATGKTFESHAFADWLFKEDRHLVVGPAIGFHPDFRKAAQGAISLSSLTFTHGLAQLILAESLYRSACLLKNHPFVK